MRLFYTLDPLENTHASTVHILRCVTLHYWIILSLVPMEHLLILKVRKSMPGWLTIKISSNATNVDVPVFDRDSVAITTTATVHE